MPVTIRAIRPRRPPFPNAGEVQSGISRYLRNFAFDVVREMGRYPAWRPWKGRPPASGPRRGGRRTGMYGRQWGANIRFTQNSVSIINPTTYSVYVGGPRGGGRGPGERQAAALRARGWPSVSDIAPVVARRNRPVLLRALHGRR